MSINSSVEKPRLRLIDGRPFEYEGMAYLMLRDPLELSEKSLLVPQPFIPLLGLLDGTRTIAALRGAMALQYGLMITGEQIEAFVENLDDALLLENHRSRQGIADAHRDYLSAPFRPPANAGLTYPESPQELSDYLQNYLNHLDTPQSANGTRIRGVVSPHIDYERGGPVYAAVWSQAAQAAREADLAIIFGTDHFSEGFPISLTRQSYATPYGVLPTAVDIIDQLAEVIGEEAAFAGELHHRREHSIELAAVWLHHMRGGQPIEMVPILCGQLEAENGRTVSRDIWLNVLRRAASGRRTLVVAAGDLAHVGPAFDGEPVNPGKLSMLRTTDDGLIEAMCDGDAERFFGAIRQVNDANNVCGVAPIYLTMRLLGDLRGQQTGYAVCPADQAETSVVTICGVTLQ
jgi:MEMO1 family protein